VITDLRAALLKLLEVGHADKSVNDRFTHPPEQAHLAASEQTAALVRKAGKAHLRTKFLSRWYRSVHHLLDPGVQVGFAVAARSAPSTADTPRRSC
jgi:hypothetical protein